MIMPVRSAAGARYGPSRTKVKINDRKTDASAMALADLAEQQQWDADMEFVKVAMRADRELTLSSKGSTVR